LLLGLTHCYGTLYVAILLAIDAVERRFNRSRLAGIGLFSLLLIWPLCQKLFGSLEMQAESNQLVEMLPFVSTLNNFSWGIYPLFWSLVSLPIRLPPQCSQPWLMPHGDRLKATAPALPKQRRRGSKLCPGTDPSPRLFPWCSFLGAAPPQAPHQSQFRSLPACWVG